MSELTDKMYRYEIVRKDAEIASLKEEITRWQNQFKMDNAHQALARVLDYLEGNP